MKREIHPAILGAIIVVALGLIVIGFYRYATPHPPSDVSYTPGVPPWMDKTKSGHSAQPDTTTPAPSDQYSQPSAEPPAPPGMTAPRTTPHGGG